MTIKPTEYKGMNIEYRIWNIGCLIQFLRNSKFCSRYSTFPIPYSSASTNQQIRVLDIPCESASSPHLPPHKSASIPRQSASSLGFTLVETLVAIAILLIAVVGPISLIGDALHKLYYAKDQMIAINLAQEGIEVVRQVRDSNMLSGVSWDAGLAVGDYVVDANSATLVTLCGPTCAVQPVYLDAQGFYQQSTVLTATPFGRIVTITSIGTDERSITSTVTWRTGGQTGTITVTEYLFRWALP